MTTKRIFLGLMSGTSCDGVDAALIEVEGMGLDMQVRFIDHCELTYQPDLRDALLDVMAPAATRTEQIARLNMTLGRAFAECAMKLLHQTEVQAPDIAAIGSHGQTICHMPRADSATPPAMPPASLQIAEPAVIAALTGATVVADFRPADIAVGGQGAPLVPWTDYVLFRSEEVTRCIQNIGGIANVTCIPAGAAPGDVRAFDTGPGCMVIDALVRRLTRGEQSFDAEGRLAARGRPDLDIVEQLMQLPYFSMPPPKSAGREQFGADFASRLDDMLSRQDASTADKLATATLLTARSIADAYRSHLESLSADREIILCGGGARNCALVAMLRQQLPGAKISKMDELGIPTKAKECVSFAMLAAACLDGVPANLPQVTGAARQVILGKVVRV